LWLEINQHASITVTRAEIFKPLAIHKKRIFTILPHTDPWNRLNRERMVSRLLICDGCPGK
jgi:hypothetical protein